MMEYGEATREACPAHGPWTLNSPILLSGLGVEKTVSQMLNSSLNVGVGVEQKKKEEEPTRREESAGGRWHWKEEFLAEDGELTGLEADRGSWSTDPTSQPQGAWSGGVREAATRGRCRQSRELLGATQVSALPGGEAD